MPILSTRSFAVNTWQKVFHPHGNTWIIQALQLLQSEDLIVPTAPHASKDFKPFLLNACFEWFVANGWTTYVGAYSALPGVVIPKDRAVNGQILISLSKDAVDDLKICVQSEVISCNAYFDGVPTKIEIPIEAVFCIYAKETNQGLSWTCDESSENDHSSNEDSSQNDVQARPPATPMLVVVKS